MNATLQSYNLTHIGNLCINQMQILMSQVHLITVITHRECQMSFCQNSAHMDAELESRKWCMHAGMISIPITNLRAN